MIIYNNAPAFREFKEKYNLRKLIEKIKKPKDDPSKIKDDTVRWDVVPTKIPMDEVLSVDFTSQTDYTSDKPKENK